MLLLVAMGGCAKKEARVVGRGEITTDAVRAQKALVARNDAIKTMRAAGKFTVVGDDLLTMDAALIVAMPNRARISLSDNLADVVSDAGIDGTRMWFTFPHEHKRYEGRASTANMKRATGFTFTPQEFVALLAGTVHLTGDEHLAQDGRTFVVQGTSLTLWMDMARGVPTRVARLVEENDEAVPYEIFFEDYRAIDGILIPHKITVSSPRDHACITLKYSQVELNRDVDENMFKMPKK